MTVTHWNLGERIFSTSLITLTLVYFGYGLHLFWKNRHLQYITARRPWIVISGTLGLNMCSLIFLLPHISFGYMNCASWSFLLTVAMQLTFSAFISRVVCLIASFDLTRQITSFSEKLGSVTNDMEREAMQNVFSRNWIMRNRHRFTNKYAIQKFLQSNLVFLIVPILLLVSNADALDHRKSDDSCSTLVEFVTFYAIVLTIVAIVIVMLLYRRIRDVQENLDIKNDFLWIAYSSLFRIFLIILTWTTPPFAYINFHIFDLSAVVLCLPNIMDTYRQFVFVSQKAEHDLIARQSSQSEGTLRSTDEELGATNRKSHQGEHFLREFLELLLDDQGCKAFEEFLQLEFSFENLLFWKQARAFRLKYYQALAMKESVEEEDVENAMKEAKFIYEQFIPCDSPMMINIGSTTRAGVVAGMSRICRRCSIVTPGEHRNLNEVYDLFTAAENEILRLMAMDSYNRFKTTPSFKSLKNARSNASMDSDNIQKRGLFRQSSATSEHDN